MEGLVSHTPMTDLLRERGVFDRHPFVLIDVGCAGGIAEPWRAFGPSLIAHGYDPDVGACEEAQAREQFPGVRYHAAIRRAARVAPVRPASTRRGRPLARHEHLGARHRGAHGRKEGRRRKAASPHRLRAWPTPRPSSAWTRSSARSGSRPSISSRWTWTGPTWRCSSRPGRCWPTRQVLGVAVEVNWFGTANPTEHTFHNTDLFLRRAGLHAVRSHRPALLAHRLARAVRA